MSDLPVGAATLGRRLAEVGHLVDDGLAAALFLAVELERPLLLEGEPGVGKTSAAKALARVCDVPLIRLQCYEGLTASEALYEWNYQRQLLAIRLAESGHRTATETELFTPEFLLERPVLRALRHPGPGRAVLLVDELDRADDEFEAMLLEFLGEWSVTVPELGTFSATRPPIVVLTSNRSRDLHDALRRRCLYHWIEPPDPARAAAILRLHVPGADAALIRSTSEFVGRARGLDLDKPPGMAELIDWVAALSALGVSELTAEHALLTVSTLAKTAEDRATVSAALSDPDPTAEPAVAVAAPEEAL